MRRCRRSNGGLVKKNANDSALVRLSDWVTKRVRRLVKMRDGDPNEFLRSCSGVVHVGANTGQEAQFYDEFGLSVLWIEPIPEVFAALERNIERYPRQRALNELIVDVDGTEVTLHVANNQGASSSILDLHQHKDIWPEVDFVRDIQCAAVTLPTALRKAAIDASAYDALIMDTQGSELSVLKGASEMLHLFRYIRTETADFEAYRNCATVDSIDAYLVAHGFSQVRKDEVVRHKDGGAYFEVLYERIA